MEIAEKFMASVTYMVDMCHHANVVNMPDMILLFSDERELAYFEKGLKLTWDVNKYGLLDIDIRNTRTLRIRGLVIKLRVRVHPEEIEIIRK